ncbi:type II toxin-antitoxin system Rv0910 family toxin [Micromonospora coxensis]|uniref:type II toxin-antitoxin system Rv0910 family toxin n=1 Tax=Micromonospora coxensis TaxID=356852 RepID=UPI00344AE48B
MTTVISTVELPAAPERVWPVLAGPAELGRWQTTHLGYQGAEPAAFTDGTTFTQKVRVMGMPAEVTWTVAEVAENTRLAMTGSGPMGITLRSSYEVEPTADGSRVRLCQQVQGTAVAAVAGPLERELRNAQEQSLARLRDAVG